MNGAEALMKTLVGRGVEVCFSNPGTSEMHFVAALDRVPEMRGVLALFEGVATGAADGYARIARKPAATLLHLGPGLGNGLANLHNARRAYSPIVNVVGEHATYHRRFDPPLASDIAATAKAVSKSVMTVERPEELIPMVAATHAAAVASPAGVATLIVPGDITWNDVPDVSVASAPAQSRSVDVERVAAAAKALRAGGATLFIGGSATTRRGLEAASRIANATSARLLCETFPAVLERGAGIPPVDRLAYLGDFALMQLAGSKSLVLAGAVDPVAFFAYPGKPSRYAPEDCQVVTLATPAEPAELFLEALAEDLGASVAPTLAPSVLPSLPSGPLSGSAVAATIGALLPEGCIVVDESVTTGIAAPGLTQGSPPHRWLTLTGGAIGYGLPVATGAAIAEPGTKVVDIQADGSALYTIQALWTQAREGLDVVTVLLNNQSYAILQMELNNVGAEAAGPRSRAMLDLIPPDMDFTSIAKGFGVDAVRVYTGEELGEQLKRALAEPGPRLIEAMLPKGIS